MLGDQLQTILYFVEHVWFALLPEIRTGRNMRLPERLPNAINVTLSDVRKLRLQ